MRIAYAPRENASKLEKRKGETKMGKKRKMRNREVGSITSLLPENQPSVHRHVLLFHFSFASFNLSCGNSCKKKGGNQPMLVSCENGVMPTQPLNDRTSQASARRRSRISVAAGKKNRQVEFIKIRSCKRAWIARINDGNLEKKVRE